MLTLDNYSSILLSATPGKKHFDQSKMIVEKTWNNSSDVKECYIYDYFHDDDSQRKNNIGIVIDDATTHKTKIECKFITLQYPTITSDLVEYGIQLRPSQLCCLDYYENTYKNPYGMEFPIGMYIDIPDEKGNYRKWLICIRDLDVEFITYHIVPCNYYFHWVKNGFIRKVWGAARIRNNYNAGIETGSITQKPDNQDQLWIPKNILSDELFYDDRLIVSDTRKEPFVWTITKPNTIHPIGINKFTIKQDKFNAAIDYIPENKETPFEMYANYYVSASTPEEEKTEVVTTDYAKIISTDKVIKVYGSYKKLTLKFYHSTGEEISDGTYKADTNKWNFICNGVDLVASGVITLVKSSVSGDYSQIKIKFLGDESYLRQIINITVTDDNNMLKASENFEVQSL